VFQPQTPETTTNAFLVSSFSHGDRSQRYIGPAHQATSAPDAQLLLLSDGDRSQRYIGPAHQVPSDPEVVKTASVEINTEAIACAIHDKPA